MMVIVQVDDGDCAQLFLLPSQEHVTSDVKPPGIGYWIVTSDGRCTVHTTQPDLFALLERSHEFIFVKDHIPFPKIIINGSPIFLYITITQSH